MLFSQQLTQQFPIPASLQAGQVSGFGEGPHGSAYVLGTALLPPPVPEFDAPNINFPYFLLVDSMGNANILNVPDTGYVSTTEEDYTHDSFETSGLLTDSGGVIFYSKQLVYEGDTPPTTYETPVGTAVRVSPATGDVETIFSATGAAYPGMSASQDGALHFVWDAHVELPPLGNSFSERYKGAVYYRRSDNLGNLSVPQFIDSGYFPQMRVGGDDSVRLLWFSGDSSTSPSMKLKYSTGKNGAFTTPQILGSQIVNLYTPGANFFVSTDGSVTQIGWVPNSGGANAKAYSYRVVNGRSELDSLTLAAGSAFSLCVFLFRPQDGATFVVWSTSVSGNDVFWSSTESGLLFSNQKTVHLSTYFNVSSFFVNPENGHPTISTISLAGVCSVNDLEALSANDTVHLPPSQWAAGPVTIAPDGEVFMLSTDKGPTTVLIRLLDGLLPVRIPSTVVRSYRLGQNYPNPFNPTTTIRYDLPKESFVHLSIFNILGQEVRTMVNQREQAGFKSVQFDGSTLASGVYFYKLTAGSFNDVKKMILLK
jgi:hypothetical protein